MTGVANIQICTTKGSIWRKSRNTTDTAAKAIPTPSDTTSASAIINGTANKELPGTMPYQYNSGASNTSAINRSTSATPTEASGTIRRGKYTLVINEPAPSTDAAAPLTA